MLLKALLFLILGSITGTCSGLVGIGGGSLLTPALIYLFGFDQHLAQGTTLTLLVAPVGLMGALAYYQKGYVDLNVGIMICIGYFVGSLLGAKLAIGLPDVFLRKAFGVMTLVIAFKMIFAK